MGEFGVSAPVSQRNPIYDAAALAKFERQIHTQVSSFLEALHITAGSGLLFATLKELTLPLGASNRLLCPFQCLRFLFG